MIRKLGLASLVSLFIALPAVAVEPPPDISPSYVVVGSNSQTVTITDSDGSATIYYTIDGTQPVPGVSSTYSSPFNITSSKTILALAVGAGGTSTVSRSDIQLDPAASTFIGISGRLLWVRADNGIILDGSKVSQWMDMAHNCTVTQSASANQPTFVSSAINGIGAVDFAASSSQFLSFTMNYGFGFYEGPTIYIVTKPVTPINTNGTLLDVGNSGTNDFGVSQTSNTGVKFWAYNGTTPSSLTGTNVLTAGQFNILEVAHLGQTSLTAALTTNGVRTGYGAIGALIDAARPSNYIGKWYTGTSADFFNGQLSELVLFNRPLTATERFQVIAYLSQRFALTPPPPTITPATGVYNSPPTYPNAGVSITTEPNTTIKFSTDGTDPTISSPTYSSSFSLADSGIVKAISVQGALTSPVSSSYIFVDLKSKNVPRDGLVTWFRSDFGTTLTGSSISRWADLSGSMVDGTQLTAGSQPTFVSDAINSQPAVNFNGSQNMNLATLFSYPFSSGATLISVARPTTLTASATLVDWGNGATSDNITLQEADTAGTGRFHSYNVSSDSYLDAANAMPAGRFTLNEVVVNGGIATFYVNGTQVSQGSINTPNTLDRISNFLGQRNGNTDRYTGNIAELMLYHKALSASELALTRSYLINKFQLLSVVPSAPIISTPTSTLPEPAQIAISAEDGSRIFMTDDGSTPTPSSQEYHSPILINFTKTIKAIAVKNGVSSTVTSATFTLNSTKWPAPSATDTTPVDFNLQLPTTAIPQ